ncbi:MAG TPA: ATP-binding protein [Roseiflexaceae bacterium]|nr:ATP-binding protein [Roseiflexaceae bacterium]HMP38793.1 ATP-binding protein [Roseiflexaceae bacterium]
MQPVEPQTLANLLAMPEGDQLAFVRGGFRPDALAETLAALANAQGGIVLIGIGRGRRLEGVADIDAAREATLDAALACTPPLALPLPVVVRHDEVDLLLVTVPAGLPHVYSVRGKYLRREGAADLPIAPDALRRLLLDRGATSWDRQPVFGATATDMDTVRVGAYARRVGPAAEADLTGFLLRRGCLVRHEDGALLPTNAGMLLFAGDVERYFPQCEITLVRYRGREMSDEFLREDIRDTLPEAVRRAEIWLSEHMRRGSRMVGLERHDWVQFPQGAVREALVNAVAHRDYTIRGEGIRIALFGDRLECYSPGRLPGHITLQNIVAERYSRNETLVQVLADFGLIERLGYGIDRMVRQMADAGLPPPDLRETAAGFLVTLRGHTGDDRHDAAGVDVSEWRRQGLNERQIAAMIYLAEQRRISNRELQELATDVSAETIRRDLADLVERGLLLRVGDKRGAYYILK